MNRNTDKEQFYDLLQLAKNVSNIQSNVQSYRNEIKELTVQPQQEIKTTFSTFLFHLFGGEIIIGIIWFVLWIILCLLDGLFLYNPISNEKILDISKFIRVFNIATLILCIIFAISTAVYCIICRKNENTEYRIQLTEFNIKRKNSKFSLEELQKQFEFKQKELTEIETEFNRICDSLSIPESYRNYYALDKIYEYSLDNYPNKTVEEWIMFYQEYERAMEMLAETESELKQIDCEIKMQKLEKETELEKARKKWSSDEEPDFYTDFYDKHGNSLKYKYTDPFGNMVMEDENGNDVDVRVNFDGRIRRKDNGEYLDRR